MPLHHPRMILSGLHIRILDHERSQLDVYFSSALSRLSRAIPSYPSRLISFGFIGLIFDFLFFLSFFQAAITGSGPFAYIDRRYLHS